MVEGDRNTHSGEHRSADVAGVIYCDRNTHSGAHGSADAAGMSLKMGHLSLLLRLEG